MGYTHYWKFNKDIQRGEQSKVEALYQTALNDCRKIVKKYQKRFESGDYRRLSGVTPHAPHYMGVSFNGAGSQAHEAFILMSHYRANDSFNFCKTAYKPYDLAVTACLLVLKHRLRDYIHVSSDGESIDWAGGLILATQATRLKLSIPTSIRQDTHAEHSYVP
jgi:hypothetical protein